MRIVFVLGSSHIGGTELNTLRTATALLRRGHDVTQILIGQPGTLIERFSATGVRIVQVPSRSLSHPTIVQTYRNVAGAMRELRAEVVHSQDVYANIIAIPAARIARAPVVVSSRRWWKATPRRVHLALNRVSYAMSDATVANAPSVAKMLIQDERLPSRKVHVVPNLVDESLLTWPDGTTRAAMRQELGLRPDAIIVMCVARLVPIKNHSMQLRALSALVKTHPEVQLVLVGGGSLQAELESMARDLGITDSVIFAGERHGAARYYHAADIAVLTSFSEGMPNSLLEAMACGLPVIATAVGGSVDVVYPERTGMLVSSDDHRGLQTALQELITSPNLRCVLGKRGYEMVKSQHTEEIVMQQLEGLYEALLQAS